MSEIGRERKAIVLMNHSEEYGGSVYDNHGRVGWDHFFSAELGCCCFVVIELRNMDRHRDLEISMKLFEWGETDRLRKAFRWIESKFEFKDLETYRAKFGKDFEAGDLQLESYFEEVGFLITRNWLIWTLFLIGLGNKSLRTGKSLSHGSSLSGLSEKTKHSGSISRSSTQKRLSI